MCRSSESWFKTQTNFCVSTVLHCTLLHCTLLHCPVLQCTTPPCHVLHLTVLQCTALCCTVTWPLALTAGGPPNDRVWVEQAVGIYPVFTSDQWVCLAHKGYQGDWRRYSLNLEKKKKKTFAFLRFRRRKNFFKKYNFDIILDFSETYIE